MLRLRHPADRVVAADDLGAGLLPEGEVLGGLPADVGAEVVHHRRLPERAQERELERLGDERQPEDEVEQVGARDQLGERAPLGGLTPDEPAVELERAVGLRVELVAVEDDERRLDPAPPERLDVRPRDARGVDGAMDDAERSLRAHSERGYPWFPYEPLVLVVTGGAGRRVGPPGRRSRPSGRAAPDHDRARYGKEPWPPRATGRTTAPCPSPIRAGRSSGARCGRGGSVRGAPPARRRPPRRARASRRGTAGSGPPGRRPSRCAD